MRCPQCGADLELDDTRDFGFCSCCGTKIMLNETIHVKHSGSVKMDNSEQAKNRLDLADRAFLSGNYVEAETYYTRVLEDLPDNLQVLYRKGICAVYNSLNSDIRTPELEMSLSVAKDKWNRAWASLSQIEGEDMEQKTALLKLQNEEAKELSCMLLAAMNELGTKASQLLNKEACDNQAARWVGLINLFNKATPYVENEKILNDTLLPIIDFCDAALNTSISFKSGVMYDKNNRAIDQYSRYFLTPQTKDYIIARRGEFADKYNNLSYKKQTRTEIENRIQELQKKVNELSENVKNTNAKYKTAKSEFWKQHPEIKKNKFLSVLKSIGIAFLISFLGLVIPALVLPKDINAWGILIWLGCTIGGIALIVFTIKKVKKTDNEVFSSEIKTIGDALASYKNELAETKDKLEEANTEMDNFLASLR